MESIYLTFARILIAKTLIVDTSRHNGNNYYAGNVLIMMNAKNTHKKFMTSNGSKKLFMNSMIFKSAILKTYAHVLIKNVLKNLINFH